MKHLESLVNDGCLYTLPGSPEKVEAILPTDRRSNHASSLIELENGDLLCAWFAGLAEGSSDISIVAARLRAGADRWEYEGVLSEDAQCSEQNPCFFQEKDGTLWLLHTAQKSRGTMTEAEWLALKSQGKVTGNFSMQETAQIRRRLSQDQGRTWQPTTVFSQKPGSFCRHPILELSNGDWLFPMWYSVEDPHSDKQYGKDYSVVRLSHDRGKTWEEVPVPDSVGRVHMTAVETCPGHLVAFFRSRWADRVYKSLSEDYGRTWSAPTPTLLPNNNASIQAAKLPSGAIALVFNPYGLPPREEKEVEWPGLRWSVSVAITEDEGETFPLQRVIEPGSGFTGAENRLENAAFEYPCLLVGRDGAIHIAYSAWNRRHIHYVRVTEGWLRSSPKNQ